MSEAINFPHLGIYLDHVGKSFSVFGIEIAYYGVTIAVAMLAGIFLALHVAKITGQNPDDYFDMAIAGIIVSVICSAISSIATSSRELFSFHFSLLQISILFSIPVSTTSFSRPANSLKGLPFLIREHKQAAVQSLRDNECLSEFLAELGRDDQPALGINRMTVFSHEHGGHLLSNDTDYVHICALWKNAIL